MTNDTRKHANTGLRFRLGMTAGPGLVRCRRDESRIGSRNFVTVLLAQAASAYDIEQPEFLDRRQFVLFGMVK